MTTDPTETEPPRGPDDLAPRLEMQAPEAALLPPPPRTALGRMSNFLVGMLVGLNLLLIGTLAFLPRGVDKNEAGRTALGDQVTALTQRVTSLESGLGKSDETAGALSGRLDSLETKLTTLAQAPATPAPAAPGAAPPPDLTAALDSLTNRIAALEAKPAAAGGVASDALAKLDQRLGALEAARGAAESGVTGRLDALDKELRDGVRPALSSLTEGIAQRASESELQALTTRLAAVEARDGRPLIKTAALALAASVLGEKVRAGTPYAEELTAVSRLADPGAATALDTLARQSAVGAPSIESLTVSFPAAARAVREAQQAPDAGMVGTLKRTFGDLVSFRVPGSTTEDALSTITRALTHDDIGKALAAAQTLDPKPRNALEPWLARAKLRQDALLAVQTIRESALRQLAVTTSP